MTRRASVRRTVAVTALAAASLPGLAFAAGALGERAFIDETIVVPAEILELVGTTLPERSKVGASYLSDVFSPNLVFDAQASVYVTFIHEGAGHKNALGYFTYSTDGGALTIVDAQLVFPNASFADPAKGWGGGTLSSGDRVELRDPDGNPRIFQPGERLGFFLVSNGWTGSSVRCWTNWVGGLPKATPAENAACSTFTTLDELNPEYTAEPSSARHVAMVRVLGTPGFAGGDPYFLLGFEDLRRDQSSDDDFNDVVVVVEANPYDAVATTDVPELVPDTPDPDGDGVEGLDDYFPNDPERAVVIKTPDTGWETLVFEDSYPGVGDADYNDVVVQYAFEEALDVAGQVRDVMATLHLVARGATYDHAFGLVLTGVPASTDGTVRFERFSSDGEQILEAPRSLDDYRYVAADGTVGLRIDDVFPSTLDALPPGDGAYSNTESTEIQVPPASVRVIVSFDAPVDREGLGLPPYDPYISVVHGELRHDVHLPGKPAFPDRPDGLPAEDGAMTFLDDQSYPWALLVPHDFRFPLERRRIDGPSAAYSRFGTWRTSVGMLERSWYAYPNTSRVSAALTTTSRTRAWSLDLGL